LRSWLGCKIIFSFISGGVYSIDPLETEKQVSVGDSVSLSCRYSSSNVYFYWYRQYPSSKLDLLLYMYETGSVWGSPPPGFSAKVQNKIVNLEISSAKLSDSALYYCAESPTVTRNPATLYKN
uniref:Ig-like domain-containing protein n=1 Tax=Pygocentrus nattereri TaxID=42514 RepID=A0A3B4E495_PYGNA